MRALTVTRVLALVADVLSLPITSTAGGPLPCRVAAAWPGVVLRRYPHVAYRTRLGRPALSPAPVAESPGNVDPRASLAPGGPPRADRPGRRRGRQGRRVGG